MRAVRVGDEIESLCGKCGLVWHIVAAMVGTKVVKVECKRCAAQHRHRLPPGSTPPAESAGKAAKRAKVRTEGSKAEATPHGAPPGTPAVEPDLSRPIKPYQPSQTYRVRDRIEHRTFGLGVVEELAGPGKIQVRFPDGPKKLLHGVPAAK